jgi:outer membrane lipoprotein SlyB
VPHPAAVVPSHGYSVAAENGRTIITVPKRQRPAKGFARGLVIFLVLACIGLGLLFGSALGLEFGLYWTFGSLGICGVSALLGALIGRGRDRRIAQSLAAAVISIDSRNIMINGHVYLREHVREWTIRWTDASGTSFVAVGSAPIMAGAMVGAAIANAANQKAALQSYRVTFDYGKDQIMAVGGMTEAGAGRVMEAIEKALERS